jgi:prepilin-type processing-associated H-X9-DG protein
MYLRDEPVKSCGKALTLAELLIAAAVLAVAVAFLVYAMTWGRAAALRRRCQSNLSLLAKGMAMYLGEHNECPYPWPAGRAGCGTTESAEAADFGGAEWFASLYWTRHVTDPTVFICPASGDSNQDGRNLGQHGCSGPGFEPGPDGKLRGDAVSYAGMADTSVAVYERVKLGKSGISCKQAIRPDLPPDEPMACDDTEGTINHGRRSKGGMNVLFFDSHVEFWTHERVDLERGVGAGELVYLRN